MRVQSPGGEDPLEEEMATHASVLAWKFPGQRYLAGYSLGDHKQLDTVEQLSTTHIQQGLPHTWSPGYQYAFISPSFH